MAENKHTAGRFAVRKTRYGVKEFDVIEVVRITAKTHTIRERDWRGRWSERRQNGPADYAAFFSDEGSALAAAEAANTVWADWQKAVDDAAEKAKAVRHDQRAHALAAARATQPGEV